MENSSLEREEMTWEITWGGFVQEIKRFCSIAAPMAASAVLGFLLQVVPMVAAGHLGEPALSAVAIATSLANVIGFSLQSGLAGGLETPCGQAYGAGEYQKLGTFTNSAIISLVIVCPPICLLWFFMDRLLILLGQDPAIAHEAQNYSMWLIPALFGSAILKPLSRFLQTKSLTLAMLLCSPVVLFANAILCWGLVYKLDMGAKGAAIAFSLSIWLNVLLLVLYVKYSSACEKTGIAFSKEALCGIGKFYRLGVPSALMLLILLSGRLHNPELETSVLTICVTISTLNFTIAYGLGTAASTRVSNELGVGNPQSARMAVLVAICLAAIQAAIVSAALLGFRHVLGYAYSNDEQALDYVAATAPLICVSVVMDSLRAVILGVAKGCRWQHLGAYINIGAFYVVGLPLATGLGFVANLKARGLWIGMPAGSLVQLTLLSLVTIYTDWRKQATDARKRIS